MPKVEERPGKTGTSYRVVYYVNGERNTYSDRDQTGGVVMSRTGLKQWHRAECGWCDRQAKGDGIFTSPATGNTVPIASCGINGHGEDFEMFPPDEGQI